uniref:Uncharacterized protein n=1 Tax=Anguilla anguilla TaxID=7936 RepID=A0A0E9UGQ5_ANGAN
MPEVDCCSLREEEEEEEEGRGKGLGWYI